MNISNQTGATAGVALMHNLPSVAVVIPCWNAERQIRRAIQSVLDQNYQGLELIVVDDGSTDNSLAVIKSFGTKIFWETGPNRGACAARNTGLSKSKAAFVLFHDADDFIEGDFIVSLAKSAQSAAADICFGPSCLEYSDKSRQSRPIPNLGLGPVRLLADMLQSNWVPAHSILWKASFLRDIGAWDPACLRNQDGELIYRALLSKPVMATTQIGNAVYMQENRVARVSGRWSKAVAISQLNNVEKLISAVENNEFASVLPSLGKSTYELASEYFMRGFAREGKHALFLARQCGFKGHHGTRVHKVACIVLGLELKQRISKLWNSASVNH